MPNIIINIGKAVTSVLVPNPPNLVLCFECSKCVLYVPNVFCMFQMCFACSKCVSVVSPIVFWLFQLCFVCSKCVLLVPNVFRLFQLCFVCFKCIFKVFIVSTFVSNVLNIICFVFCTYGPP